jgi:hypothetical protein
LLRRPLNLQAHKNILLENQYSMVQA